MNGHIMRNHVKDIYFCQLQSVNLEKLHYSQLCSLENYVCYKKKKAIKDQRNLSLNTIFELCSPILGLLMLRYNVRIFFTKKKDTFFLISPIGNHPKNKKIKRIFDNYNIVQSIPYKNFSFPYVW